MLSIIKYPAIFFVFGVISVFNIEKIQAYPAELIQAPLAAYLTLNVPETHSRDITSFHKWTRVLTRMDAHTKPLRPWLDNRKALEGLSEEDMVRKVNDIINNYDHAADLDTWGSSDYWATPAEFFVHGGDCEDFVIAKYAWLRSLGVSEERLRIAIVHDRIRNMPHAILILNINNKAVILDSQVKEIRDSAAASRYKLIYSINRLGWWHPAKPEDVKVSMIESLKGSAGAVSDDHAIQFFKECLTGPSLPECINAIEPAAR